MRVAVAVASTPVQCCWSVALDPRTSAAAAAVVGNQPIVGVGGGGTGVVVAAVVGAVGRRCIAHLRTSVVVVARRCWHWKIGGERSTNG